MLLRFFEASYRWPYVVDGQTGSYPYTSESYRVGISVLVFWPSLKLETVTCRHQQHFASGHRGRPAIQDFGDVPEIKNDGADFQAEVLVVSASVYGASIEIGALYFE